MGLVIGEAVERMAERVPITETNFFAIVISIQAKAGGNLTEALGNLSRVIRDRKEDEGQGQGHLLRSQGLGGDHRQPALHRRRSWCG